MITASVSSACFSPVCKSPKFHTFERHTSPANVGATSKTSRYHIRTEHPFSRTIRTHALASYKVRAADLRDSPEPHPMIRFGNNSATNGCYQNVPMCTGKICIKGTCLGLYFKETEEK